MEELSLEEKIAQTLMVAAYSNRGEGHIRELEELVRKHKIGGVMFLQGGPLRQAKMTNRLQRSAHIPLLVALDAEWGLNMRLDSTQAFPFALTTGAMRSDSLTYEMGLEIGKQLRAIGVHFNFAPVADVNNNPENPIINARSFGENKYRVSQHAIAYMKGLQDAGVLACAKHFPGHGDTDSDSHKTLPIIKHGRNRLDSLEIYPFKRLIEEGLASVMTAHLFIPSLDDTENRASTLSPNVVNGLLKDELGFKGLAITDALNMKGVSAYFAPGEVDMRAFLAGNDILLFSEDVPAAIRMIRNSVKSGMISEVEINNRCRKILMAKKWLGLDEDSEVSTDAIPALLNSQKGKQIRKAQYEKAMTLIQDPKGLIPFKGLDTLKLAYIPLGTTSGETFSKTLNKYLPVKEIPKRIYTSPIDLQRALATTNMVIVGFHTNPKNPWQSYKLSEEDKKVLRALKLMNKPWTFVQFANPYAAHEQEILSSATAHLLAYQNDTLAQSVAAQALFGALPINGQAPVGAAMVFDEGQGLARESLKRLSYGSFEEMGLDPKSFFKVDSLVLDAIEQEATPGAQVLVAYKGKVIFHKAYGFHTYNGLKKVEDHHIYDLASITKVSATLPLVMDWVGNKKISLQDSMIKLNPKLAGSDKADLKLREVLTHTSGLPAWIPFYVESMEKGKLKDSLFSTVQDFAFPYEVAGGMFMNRAYADSMMKAIYEVPLNGKKYKYSDLGYYLIKEGFDLQMEEDVEDYLNNRFYSKLGAFTMGYHPRKRFFLEKIIPTEYDTYFRNQLIHGYVHDPGAAMLGGAGGHAGLFSSANDLAKLFQMYLQEGYYGGEQFIPSEVIQEFTRYQFPGTDNRRGVGFDKPVQKGNGGPAAPSASPSSFGHSGFTGTLAWADPEHDLVFIFLSNRVYPRGDNYKLISLDVRTKIQEEIYKAIEKLEINQIP